MSATLGIVVPAYRPDVDALTAYVRALADRLDPEAIRIELDAPDPAAVDALAALPVACLAVNAVDERRGKGAAITAGFEALSTDVLAFADADGATPADEFARVVDPVQSGAVPVAVGSRRHPEAQVATHQGFARRHLGDGFAWLARRALDAPLYDYQCGAKALTAGAWAAVREDLHEPGFAWDIELVALAAAHGFEIREVPIAWEDKPGSTVHPVADGLRVIRGLVVARHRAKRVAGSRLHRRIAALFGTDRPSLAARVGGERAVEGDDATTGAASGRDVDGTATDGDR